MSACGRFHYTRPGDAREMKFGEPIACDCIMQAIEGRNPAALAELEKRAEQLLLRVDRFAERDGGNAAFMGSYRETLRAALAAWRKETGS